MPRPDDWSDVPSATELLNAERWRQRFAIALFLLAFAVLCAALVRGLN
jgi:hypothetical protein